MQIGFSCCFFSKSKDAYRLSIWQSKEMFIILNFPLKFAFHNWYNVGIDFQQTLRPHFGGIIHRFCLSELESVVYAMSAWFYWLSLLARIYWFAVFDTQLAISGIPGFNQTKFFAFLLDWKLFVLFES